MTAIPQPGTSRLVSDRIANPLRAVAARQWNVLAATGAVKMLFAVLAVLIISSALLGGLTSMPAPLRIAVAAAAWAAVLAAAVLCLRPVFRRRSLADAAFTVEQRTPGLHERLSSTVELAAASEPFAGSPALLRHLARQAEADAAAVRPDQVIPTDALKRWAAALAPLLLLWLVLLVLFPRPLLAGLYRTLMPWKADVPVALARIAVTPGDVTVAEGDSLEVQATVNGKSAAGSAPDAALLLTAPLDTGADDQPLSRDLQRLAPGQFKATLNNLRQTFRYRVSTGRGDSPWFTATVLSRPAVARLDVRYDYPAYAKVDAKTVSNADGALRALQGTDVTLTVHASESLDLASGKSRITVTEGSRQRTVDLKPADGQPNVYEAKLTVFNSGSYRIQLVNPHGLANRDDQPRPIVAEMDQPPKVAITAPESQATVRPDDDVPVTFNASDDFGVAKVKAVVQVDDQPPEERDVALPPGADARRFDGQHLLDVAGVLARAGVEDPKAITYWLRVTDNRDPDPQTAESARQTLKIDKSQPLAYRARVEQEQAKDLVRAIDKAIERLSQSEGQVNALKSIDPRRGMNADETRRADEQRDHLAKTGKELADAAEENVRTAFREVADRAQAVAEGPITGAAEDVARSRLNGDDAEARKAAAKRAAEQVADAKKQLEELKKKVEARARDVQAERELEKLAEKQTDLAQAQAEAGEKPRAGGDAPADAQADAQAKQAWQQAQQKFQQRQRELFDRLNRAISQDEALRDPKAAEQASRLRELLDRVQQIQKDQAPLRDQVAKQDALAAARDRAEELAERQRELNDEIEQFARNQRPALRTAEARTPDPSHQAAILDRLRKAEMEPARDLQRQSADQLAQAAQKLEKRGRANDLKPDPVQQNALNLQEQAKQAAQQSADQAKQAAEKLKQANAAKNAEQTAQAQKELDQAAEKLKKQAAAAEAAVAEAAQSDDPTAKKNAEDAKKAADAVGAAADAARQAAQQGNADDAAKQLEQAGQQLAAARQKAADAVKADFLDDQRDAANEAARQAKDLAERQKQLADAAQDNADGLAKARKDVQSPQDVANRQNQLKDQTNQARQQADQLERLAQSNNSELAARAAAAEKLLEEAAAAEAQAAQAEQASAAAQQQGEQLLQQAAVVDQQAAQFDQQAGQVSDQADAGDQQAEAARQNAAAAGARGDENAAKGESQRADGEKQKAALARQVAQGLEKEEAGAEQRAAQAVKQADAAQASAASSRKQASEKQAAALEALAKAEEALRDLDRMAPDLAAAAAARGKSRGADAEKGEPANPQTPADAQAAADRQSADGGAEGRPAPAPLTPEQAMQRAAQAAQEAAQAQQQAMGSANDPANALDASQQAAAALRQAAEAMAAATQLPSAGASTESVATTPEEQTPSQGLGKADAAEPARAGQALDSRHGIGVSAGGTDDRPVSVRQLGISAGDWARLAPLTRQELLNAAQQTGPPAYREMIKNYYVRIARMDRGGKAPPPPAPPQKRNAKK